MSNIQKTIKLGAIIFGIFIISMIIQVLLFFLSLFVRLPNNDVKFSEVYENINNIDVNLNSSNLIIKEGTQYKVEITNSNRSLKVSLNGSDLQIKDKHNNFFSNSNPPVITVYLPKDARINQTKIDSGAGKVEINDLNSHYFEMDQGVGQLKIANSNFNKSEIDGGVGEISIVDSVLNNLNLDSGVGKVTIKSFLTGSSFINSGIGEVNLTLQGNHDDYQIKTQKGIGTIKINGISQSNNNIYGNGNNLIDIETGIGTAKIYFE